MGEHVGNPRNVPIRTLHITCVHIYRYIHYCIHFSTEQTTSKWLGWCITYIAIAVISSGKLLWTKRGLYVHHLLSTVLYENTDVLSKCKWANINISTSVPKGGSTFSISTRLLPQERCNSQNYFPCTFNSIGRNWQLVWPTVDLQVCSTPWWQQNRVIWNFLVQLNYFSIEWTTSKWPGRCLMYIALVVLLSIKVLSTKLGLNRHQSSSRVLYENILVLNKYANTNISASIPQVESWSILVSLI